MRRFNDDPRGNSKPFFGEAGPAATAEDSIHQVAAKPLDYFVDWQLEPESKVEAELVGYRTDDADNVFALHADGRSEEINIPEKNRMLKSRHTRYWAPSVRPRAVVVGIAAGLLADAFLIVLKLCK